MNLKESIRLSLDNIRLNRMRSILTMLGIIIGISAVITITTIGNSLKRTISVSMKSLGGVNSIECYMTADYPEDGNWDNWEYPETREEDLLTWEDMSGLMDYEGDNIEGVVLNSGFGSGTVNTDTGSAKVTLTGSSAGYFKTNKIDLISGRDFTRRDNDEQKASAIVSDLFVKYACDGKNPVGQKIQVELSSGNILNVYVAGVYHYDKRRMGTAGSKIAEKDIETAIYLPFTYLKEKGGDESPYYQIDFFTVVTKEGTDTVALTEDVKKYFDENKYNGTDANEQFGVQTYDMASELSQITKILDIVTIAIAIIASISLIVGGVGVMNIMLVSVVERTREIGIRKALGARKKNIRLQFLTEAVVICFIGGIIGVSIGIANGFLLSLVGGHLIENMEPEMASYLTISVSPSIPAIVISVVFSMLVGIVFGSYPAKRAAELSPIEALRYE